MFSSNLRSSSSPVGACVTFFSSSSPPSSYSPLPALLSILPMTRTAASRRLSSVASELFTRKLLISPVRLKSFLAYSAGPSKTIRVDVLWMSAGTFAWASSSFASSSEGSGPSITCSRGSLMLDSASEADFCCWCSGDAYMRPTIWPSFKLLLKMRYAFSFCIICGLLLLFELESTTAI